MKSLRVFVIVVMWGVVACAEAEVTPVPTPTCIPVLQSRLPLPTLVPEQANLLANRPITLPTITPLKLSVCASDEITPDNVQNVEIKAQWGKGHPRVVLLAPNGKFIAISVGYRIDLYETETWTQVVQITAPWYALDMVFEPNGETIFVGSADGKVRRFDLRTGELWFICDGFDQSHSIERVEFSNDGPFVIAWAKSIYNDGMQRKIKYWKAATGKLLGQLKQVNILPRPEPRLPDGRPVRLTTGSGGIYISDLSGNVIHIIPNYFSRPIRALVLSPDDHQLAMMSGNDDIVVWDVQTQKEILTYQGYKEVYFTPDNRLIGWTAQTNLKIFDVRNNKELHALSDGKTVFNSISFSADKTKVAVGGQSEVKVWDIPSGRLLWKSTEDLGERKKPHPIQSMNFSPDGKLLIAAGGVSRQNRYDLEEYSMTLWDAEQGRKFFTSICPSFKSSVRQLCVSNVKFSPDGTMLYSTQSNNFVDLLEGRSIPPEPPYMNAIAISPNGSVIVGSDFYGVLHFRATADLRVIHSINTHSFGTTALTFSPDGRLLATASADGVVRLWGVK